MIKAFIELQKIVKCISITNKKLEPIIHNYTFLLVQEDMKENEQNQLIFQNFMNSEVIIINKFNELFSNSGSEYFVTSFKNTILLVMDKSSIQFLKNLFTSKKNLKLCFLNKTKEIFDQNCQVIYTPIGYNKYFNTEIDSFYKSFEINGFKNSIRKTWEIIARCISAYFIKMNISRYF